MKVKIRPWQECLEDFLTFDIPVNEQVDLTNEQMEQLSGKFDIMIRNHEYPTTAHTGGSISKMVSEKIMYLSPCGRGFGQR